MTPNLDPLVCGSQKRHGDSLGSENRSHLQGASPQAEPPGLGSSWENLFFLAENGDISLWELTGGRLRRPETPGAPAHGEVGSSLCQSPGVEASAGISTLQMERQKIHGMAEVSHWRVAE